MFEWIIDTKFGKALKEISEVFQPTYDDINGWKSIKEIGDFSDDTLKEWQEAWAVIPKSHKKLIYKAFEFLTKAIDKELLAKLLQLYMEHIKNA